MKRCACGKLIYSSAQDAMTSAFEQKSPVTLWAYQCRIAPKGTFHLTKKHGSRKYKVGGIKP